MSIKMQQDFSVMKQTTGAPGISVKTVTGEGRRTVTNDPTYARRRIGWPFVVIAYASMRPFAPRRTQVRVRNQMPRKGRDTRSLRQDGATLNAARAKLILSHRLGNHLLDTWVDVSTESAVCDIPADQNLGHPILVADDTRRVNLVG